MSPGDSVEQLAKRGPIHISLKMNVQLALSSGLGGEDRNFFVRGATPVLSVSGFRLRFRLAEGAPNAL
jgi:hypothetical protein